MSSEDRPGWNPPELPSFDPTSTNTPDVVASAGPRRSRLGTGIAIAAIGIGALGVAGTAYASSSSPSPTPSGSGQPGYGATGSSGTERPAMPGPAGGMAHHDHDHVRGGMGMGMGRAIHGSFVTPKQGGGYQTVDTQRGIVTGVSSTAITVKSVDGFTATYAVDATTMVNAQRDGIASVTVGDEVGVTAIESGSTKQAVQIVDRTQLGDMHDKVGGGPAAKPTPTPTPTSTA